MQVKGLKFEIKAVNDRGEIEGYASTFGNEDLGGDIVEKGAFRKTISDGNIALPILWGHDMRELVGVNKEMREDDVGLWVKGEINLEVSRGREAHSLAKQGAVRGLSIGYEPVKWEYVKQGEFNYVRLLKEVKLYEYSLTPIPMNPLATIESVKTFDGLLAELKAGRTISAATRSRLERIVEEVSALLSSDADEQTEDEAAKSARRAAEKALVEQLKSIQELSRWN